MRNTVAMRHAIVGVILIFSAVIYALLFVALCQPRVPGDIDLILIAFAVYCIPGLCLLFYAGVKRTSPHPNPCLKDLSEGEGTSKKLTPNS